ncbi:DUF6875 domain-containing protein [Bosea sp. NPDC055332]
MLDRVARTAQARDALLSFAQARADIAADPAANAALATLLGWVEAYLMREHPDLGRTGAVCPFTRQAARIDTARLAICSANPEEEERAFALIRGSFGALDAIVSKPGMAHFRTVIVGFPNCADERGIAMLQRVQKRHKFYSLARSRMVGLMYEGSEAPGLWNRDFRPLRAPLPVLAIRHMVEHDAPFAARHPLLLVPYLAKFRLAGGRRLIDHLRGQG